MSLMKCLDMSIIRFLIGVFGFFGISSKLIFLIGFIIMFMLWLFIGVCIVLLECILKWLVRSGIGIWIRYRK